MSQPGENALVAPSPDLPAAGSAGTKPHFPPRTTAMKALLVVIAVAAVAAGVVLATRPKEVAAPPSDIPTRVGDAIEVTEAFRDRAGIATTNVVRSPLAPLVRVVGAATFDPTRVASVGTRSPGIVTDVFHLEGDIVKKGDVLAEIDSPGLADAQAELRVALAKRKAATINAKRESVLLARQLTTAREYEQAVASLAEESALAASAEERVEVLGGGERWAVSQLRAPVAGIVAERSIAPAQNVGGGLVAFRVGDLDALWVLLRVFEKHVAMLRVGDEVEIRAVSGETQAIAGKVAHVGSVLDATTRTADVRVVIANSGLLLRPGQAVEATIRASGPAKDALSVPASAVTYVDGSPTVFVAETPTRFAVRKVTLGIDGGDRIEIETGVNEGDAVVSQSVLALKSELFR